MPPLHLRQEFPTLKAFKEALYAWAIEAHFEPRILKSDTGRVRVGCKRDANCPFVIRCNWERKGGREPLARVTVLREKHTCLNGVEWLAAARGGDGLEPDAAHGMGAVEMRRDDDGNIIGGARVLGPVEGRPRDSSGAQGPPLAPVLPKVQRNSASRLPFLVDILPRLMNVTKQTTPVEIRECLLREYGAEVHLQQCRRAKTEILKQRAAAEMDGPADLGPPPGQSMDGMGSEGPGDPSQQLFGDMNVSPHPSPNPFTLHTAQGVVTPVMADRSASALRTVGEPPVRCPYCINHRWMRSIKDAVEHMSMHVVV